MKLSEITEAYRNASKEERREFIEQIIPDLEEKITIIIENVLLTSDLKLVKRIANLENVTGLTDYSDFEEDHEPTIPDRIEALEQRAVLAPEKPIEEEKVNSPISPETTLDLKACEVVKYLKEEVKHNDFGEIVLDKKELSDFMTTKIPVDLRVKNVTRQLKADVFERAAKLFPNVVYIKTSPSGNKTKSLALKTSVKRTNTNACARLTGLGIWS